MPLKPGETPPPAGGDNPGAFDPKAFRDEIMGEFNKTLNGFAASLKNDVKKLFEAKPPETPPVDPVNPNPPSPEPPKKLSDAEMNAAIQRLTRESELTKRELVEEKKRRETAEAQKLETDRMSEITRVLADIPFANDKDRQLFRDALQSRIKRGEDGNLSADTDKGPIAFEEYLRSEAEARPNLLAPQGKSGSGAAPGQKPGMAAKRDTLSMTTAEILQMKPEDRSAMLAENVRGLMSTP